MRVDSSRPRQFYLEWDATLLKQFNETVIIYLLVKTHIDPKQTHASQEMSLITVCPAFDVFKQTVETLFPWASSYLNNVLPKRLDFAFTDFHTVELIKEVNQGDTKAFETVKTLTWERFKSTAGPPPASDKIRILITPYFSSASEAPQIASLPLTSKKQSQPVSITTRNQHDSNTASDSTHRPSLSRPGGPPHISPPSQSQSKISVSSASGPSNSHRRPTTPASSSDPIIIEDDTPERKVFGDKDNMTSTSFTNSPNPNRQIEKPSTQIPVSESALPTPSQEPPKDNPQHQEPPKDNPQHQTTETPISQNKPLNNATPTTSKVRPTEAHRTGTNPSSPLNQKSQPAVQGPSPNPTPPTPKIVIRIQVSASGQLSKVYPHSVLNTRTKCSKFFSWFEAETNHTCSGKLRFDFKDALPAKSSIVERSNEDHFDLMVGDIKRKFERALKLAPDLKEFCVVVTDPEWEEEEEEEDE